MSERRWTPRSTAAAVVFLTIAILIVGIPVLATQAPRPARFGWQMYSTVSEVPEVWTEDASGARTWIDVMPFMGDGRAEIIWGPHLVDALCSSGDVHAVVVRERDAEERVPCS